MDFFSEQDQARRRSKHLVWYFIAAIVGIIALLYFTAMLAIFWGDGGRFEIWNPEVFLVISGIAIVIISLGSLGRVFSLSGGGKSVAEMLGGRLLNNNTYDKDERRLLNVVEEMAIASGMPVPPVYILEEDGINAFAAGYRTENAVIGVTRGAIQKLNRDELQGVVAHEFSHILHGDMRLNIRLMGLLYGILMISIIGGILMRSLRYSGRRSSKEGGGALLAIFMVGLAAYIIGYIGVFVGGLIKAAVSRQREFLADASAVQYTRNPDGIGGALKKLLEGHSNIENKNAGEASHFFFGEISSLSNLMATHPPLKERIKRIDPHYNKELAEALATEGDIHAEMHGGAMGFAGGSAHNEQAKAKETAAFQGISPERMLESIGDPGAEHLLYSQALLAHMDEQVHDACHDPYTARAIIYCLLLDKDQTIAQQQWKKMEDFAEASVVKHARELLPMIERLETHARLPILELCMPALEQLSKRQVKAFLIVIDALIVADEEVTAFEYALRHHLRIAIDPSFEKEVHDKASNKDVKLLLTIIAQVGNPFDKQAAGKAFVSASQSLGIKINKDITISTRDIQWDKLDHALIRLSRSNADTKKKLLTAAATAVAADGIITSEEADVLRTIGATLNCPIPPIVPGGVFD